MFQFVRTGARDIFSPIAGGISRLKHLVGSFNDVFDCPKYPPHVCEEIRTYMKKKEMSKVENIINSTIQHVDYDLEYDKDCEEVDAANVPHRKIQGVLDALVEEVGEENVVQIVTNNASAYN
ncbi:hypothetical protein E3N88_39848 [Mikania micrantha]|uniref:DUF659 domain-containing protein n=1 Tax=Mikania micrantha TaxID=192012 RepID=A0A5N6LLT5_9ASTR|nr:hypothetical protein E3N88_39848 [Mikania micrantha]